MSVRVRCPHPNCGKKYKVDEDQLGRKTVCRECGREFTLAEASRETLRPDAQADTQESDEPKPGLEPAGDVPKRLGRFEIRSRLGAGGFGTVYRAYDPVLQREVALKVPRAAVLESEKARARFLREPKAAAQLRHPHIVPVYDAGSDGDRYYIASAYIEGQTLEGVIREQRPDFRHSARIVRALAEALDYAHRTGVVHRDVKPSNVMVDSRSQPMLMDFGLARVEESEERLTQDGTVLGTPAYMAPEQANQSFGEVGPASDQYALGVVLYELLTGQTPFSGPPSVVLFNLVKQEPDRPRSKDARIPRDLETICLKAMSKRPEERYADCGTLAEDLRRWLADEPIVARPLGPVERMVRWSKRNPVIAALLAVVVLVTCVGLTAVTWQWRRAEGHRARAELALAESKRQEEKATTQERLARQSAKDEQKQKRLALKAHELAEKKREEAERAQRDLEASIKAVEDERNRALKAEEEASSAKNDAVSAAEKLKVALEEANRQRSRAEEGERIARRRLYALEMNLAMQAFEAMNWERLRQLLLNQEGGLRSFEWHYLAGQFGLGGKPHRRARTDRLRHSDAVNRLEFSPDGKYLIAQADDMSVRVWDVTAAPKLKHSYAPPEELLKLEREGSPAGSDALRFEPLVLSPDGANAAVASRHTGGVVLYEIEAQRELKLVDKTQGLSCCAPVAWAPDGQTVAAVCVVDEYALVVPLIDRARRELIAEAEIHGVPFSLTDVAPRTRRLVGQVLGKEGLRLVADEITDFLTIGEHRLWPAVAIYDTYGGKRQGLAPSNPVWLPPENNHGVRWLVFSNDGQVLAGAHWRMLKPPPGRSGRPKLIPTVSLWDVAEGSVRLTFDLPPMERSSAWEWASRDRLAFSTDDKKLVLLCFPERPPDPVTLPRPTIYVWDTDTPGAPLQFEGPPGAHTLGFSSDGTTMALWRGLDHRATPRQRRESSTGTSVSLWDLKSGKPRENEFEGHKFVVRSVAFAHDGKTIATASEDKTVKLWDPATGRERVTFRDHPSKVLSVAFSPDGTILASGNADGTIRLHHADPSSAESFLHATSVPDPEFSILSEIGLHVDVDRPAEASDEPGPIRVQDVFKDTPAWRAAFRKGDVIVSVNRNAVKSLEQLKAMLYDSEMGPELDVVVERDGTRHELLVFVDNLTPPPGETVDRKPNVGDEEDP